MQINFYTPGFTNIKNRNFYSNPNKATTLNCNNYNSINFKCNIGNTNIPKIESEEEYDATLEKIKTDKTWSSWWNHGRATKYEQGILPYIGEQDRSALINGYLRYGNVTYNIFSEDIMKNYIQVMDYALNKIDETYGKYQGIVYRIGEVDNITKNYVSTARDPNGLTSLINSRASYYKPFYIIETKHGHKAEDIQKKLSSNYQHIHESEIILDPGTHFEEIKERTPEMEKLKENLRKSLFDDYGPVPELSVTFLKEI